MSSPIGDLALELTLQHALKELRSNPDRFLPEIFDFLNNPVFQAKFGPKFIEDIRRYIQTTEITIVNGFDVDPARLPSINITQRDLSPAQAFIGDQGFQTFEPVQQYERVVLVQPFQPKLITLSADKTTAVITLPASMTGDQQNLFFKGMSIVDASGQEFYLDQDPTTTNPMISQLPGGTPVTKLNASSLKVITPYKDLPVKKGAMQYSESLSITIHSDNNSRNGVYLWKIIMWALLRYRPFMAQVFGIDLAFSSSSDYVKVNELLPAQVWMRTISLTYQSLWTWQQDPTADILGYVLSLTPGRVNNS